MALIGIESLSAQHKAALSLTLVAPLNRIPGAGLPDSSTLILTHIPRTGGVSMDALLLAIANWSRRGWVRLAGDAYGQYWGGDKPDVMQSAEQQLGDLQIAGYISGHMPFGIHRRLNKEPVYATVLRDPVERGWSQIRRIARDDPGVANVPVPDLLADGRLVDNQQVRMIAGCTDITQTCDTAMLDEAKENLRNVYALIGLANDFDGFVSTLTCGLGWPALLFRARNISQALPDAPTEEGRHALAAHSALDSELLDFAERLVEEKQRGFLERFGGCSSDLSSPAAEILYSIDPFAINDKAIGLLSDTDYQKVSSHLEGQGVVIKEIRK